MINGPWLKNSIMAKRGLAKGQAGQRHELSITAQGDFHYVYGPYAKPVLTVNPGDVVVVETEDAVGGADYGFDEIDAYMLLSQVGRIRLGNMVGRVGPEKISGLMTYRQHGGG